MARLDKDPPEAGSEFANTGVVSPTDRPALATSLGREPSAGDTAPPGSVEADEIRDKSVGSRPVNDRTDFHTSGTGAIETDDGLDERSEAVRSQAEDLDDDQPSEDEEDGPVFDRADTL